MEQGGGAKKTLASTLQLFKDLSHSTANLMSGKHDDEEEDPDYIKVYTGLANNMLLHLLCQATATLSRCCNKPCT